MAMVVLPLNLRSFEALASSVVGTSEVDPSIAGASVVGPSIAVASVVDPSTVEASEVDPSTVGALVAERQEAAVAMEAVDTFALAV